MLRKRYSLLDTAGDPPPGNSSPSPTPSPSPQPETFSKEYVRELRHENAGYRLKAQEAERKLQEAEERATKAEKDASDKVTAAQGEATARLIRAEVKAVALKAGIVDIDGLALADLSKVKFNDKGELEGADDAIEALKKAKPYLFTKTTSSTTQPPPRREDKPKHARDMTEEEFAAEMRKLGVR